MIFDGSDDNCCGDVDGGEGGEGGDNGEDGTGGDGSTDCENDDSGSGDGGLIYLYFLWTHMNPSIPDKRKK